jgi:hypothetical protein
MMMTDPVVYRSRARVERIKGPLRRAYLPAAEEPVFFGMHSEIIEHYGIDPTKIEPRTTTIDYVVAATGA